MNIKQQSFILNSWEKTYMLANPYDKEFKLLPRHI
jgi:hypothetical protein